jgi:hypothetical protein
MRIYIYDPIRRQKETPGHELIISQRHYGRSGVAVDPLIRPGGTGEPQREHAKDDRGQLVSVARWTFQVGGDLS